MIAYLTDVEGRWDKVESFCQGNSLVALDGSALRLAGDATFVFGGDAVDRGAHGLQIVETLVAAKRAYGDRVVLLAGNRDINKLRLLHELTGHPPADAPHTATRATLLRWILDHTMGARAAFAFRATELAARAQPHDDEAVVASFLADVSPGGAVRAYLAEACLAHRIDDTLFVHGGVTAENAGLVPGNSTRARDVDAWIAGLDRFYREQLAEVSAGRTPDALIAYQAPHPGSRENPDSVVYARPTDDDGNPQLPPAHVIAWLAASGVRRVVVGHTPSGDTPAVLRSADGAFELVLADNSYGRLEHGSLVVLDDATTRVRGCAELDGGRPVNIDFTLARSDRTSPIGRVDQRSSRLVKAPLSGDHYLLFRGLPEHRIEQLDDVIAGRELAAPGVKE